MIYPSLNTHKALTCVSEAKATVCESGETGTQISAFFMQKYKGKLIGNTIVFLNLDGEQRAFDFYVKEKDREVMREWIAYYKAINVVDYLENSPGEPKSGEGL